MPNFAVIENDIVINVIVCESKKLAEEITSKTCIEYTDKNPASIGWSYDGKTFIPPAQPQPVDPVNH
jgi:hypothetical protein